jgi:hypothetical protein
MINLTDLNDEFSAPATSATLTWRPAIFSKLKAFLERLSKALIASRQNQANSYVRSYYARQDDADLARMGMSSSEIQTVRNGTWQPAKFL